MSRLKDKVAFITGAAQGQGRSHAIMMAEEGADIIAVDIGQGKTAESAVPSVLRATVAEVEKRGRRIVARHADVRNLAQLQSAVDEGVRELGRLDYVVANAAIAAKGPIFEHTEEQWSRLLEVNLRGVWATCKAASPYLKKGASIVLVGSTASLKPAPGYAAYCAAKHGLVGLMHTMTLELAPLGVRVNAVHPGIVDTTMFHNPEMYKLIAGNENASREEIAAILKPRSPMGIPWVEPSDISNAVIFLCSDEARYITGADLPVDAGSAAR
jgi:(+)-trans-carveol dehydrogenase